MKVLEKRKKWIMTGIGFAILCCFAFACPIFFGDPSTFTTCFLMYISILLIILFFYVEKILKREISHWQTGRTSLEKCHLADLKEEIARHTQQLTSIRNQLNVIITQDEPKKHECYYEKGENGITLIAPPYKIIIPDFI